MYSGKLGNMEVIELAKRNRLWRQILKVEHGQVGRFLCLFFCGLVFLSDFSSDFSSDCSSLLLLLLLLFLVCTGVLCTRVDLSCTLFLTLWPSVSAFFVIPSRPTGAHD
jgi:hypothetical protein